MLTPSQVTGQNSGPEVRAGGLLVDDARLFGQFVSIFPGCCGGKNGLLYAPCLSASPQPVLASLIIVVSDLLDLSEDSQF